MMAHMTASLEIAYTHNHKCAFCVDLRLIVVSRFHPLPVVKMLLPFVAWARPFAMFCVHKEVGAGLTMLYQLFSPSHPFPPPPLFPTPVGTTSSFADSLLFSCSHTHPPHTRKTVFALPHHPQPLLECYQAVRGAGAMNLKIMQTFTREYQVLPDLRPSLVPM